LGVLLPRANLGASAVCGVVTDRRGGVVVPAVDVVFAASALSRCTVGVPRAVTFNGGRFNGSNDG
jgi:hypothetical protein